MFNMDLQPSAPYASASSFPSPVCEPEDPLLFGNRFQSYNQEFPASNCNGNNDFTFQMNPITSKTGLGSSSRFFTSTNASLVSLEKRPGPYYSQNKIAYQVPNEGSVTSNLAAQANTSNPSLQELLLNCSQKLAAFEHQHRKPSARSPTTRLMEKIRHLEEILRNVDNSMSAKTFNMFSRKQTLPNPHKHQWRRLDFLHDPIARVANVSKVSIPEGDPFETRESLSRIEFKAEIDKVAGDLGERWSKSPGTSQGRRSTIVKRLRQGPVMPVSTERDSCEAVALLYEMLRRVDALEDYLTRGKRCTEIANKKKKPAMKKVCKSSPRPSISSTKVAASKRRLWVIPRTAGKRIITLLPGQIARHVASIYKRLNKTDNAVRQLGQQLCDKASPEEISSGNDNKSVGRGMWAGNRSRSKNLTNFADTAKKRITYSDEKPSHDNMSRLTMKQIQDQIWSLKNDNQHVVRIAERIQKQCSEQSMEIEVY